MFLCLSSGALEKKEIFLSENIATCYFYAYILDCVYFSSEGQMLVENIAIYVHNVDLHGTIWQQATC